MMPVRKWNEQQAKQSGLQQLATVNDGHRGHVCGPQLSVSGLCWPPAPPLDHYWACGGSPLWPAGHFGTYWQGTPVPRPRTKEASVQKAALVLCTMMRSCDIKNLALHVLSRPCGCNDNSLPAMPPVASVMPVSICKNIDNKFSQKKIEVLPCEWRNALPSDMPVDDKPCADVSTQTPARRMRLALPRHRWARRSIVRPCRGFVKLRGAGPKRKDKCGSKPQHFRIHDDLEQLDEM